MSAPNLAQLKQAVTIAEQIQKLEAEFTSIVGGSSPVASTPAAKKGNHTSPEARARIGAALKSPVGGKEEIVANGGDTQHLSTIRFILGLTVLLTCTGCASRKKTMHYSEPGMFAPNLDSEERAFFYGSFFKRKGT